MPTVRTRQHNAIRPNMVVACRQDEVLFQPAAMATNTQPKPCPISSPHSREDCSWTVAASCLVDDDTTWRLKGARRNRGRGSAEGLLGAYENTRGSLPFAFRRETLSWLYSGVVLTLGSTEIQPRPSCADVRLVLIRE
jgi:hypothetical protein